MGEWNSWPDSGVVNVIGDRLDCDWKWKVALVTIGAIMEHSLMTRRCTDESPRGSET